ncbi:MAG: acyltransferase [Rhizobiaceae bacterium]
MNPRLSLWLDGLRVIAAFTVLLSHIAYERYTGTRYGFFRDYNLGSDAVVIFFVLSGFLIAYAAEMRDRTLSAYAWSRATRLWSVALPALLLTFVLDRLGLLINPAAYFAPFYEPIPLGELLARGLSFSNEWFLDSVRLGSNGPWWSLSYEAGYYALFGAAFFLRGPARIAIMLAVAVLIGPRPLLLLPVWLSGVVLWRLAAAGRLNLGAPLAWTFAVLPPLAYGACLALDVPHALMNASAQMTGLEVKTWRVLTGFSDEILWNSLVAALMSLHLAGIASLPQRSLPAPAMSVRAAKAVKWLAGGTFSLYLMHYPVLQFADAVLPETMNLPVRDLALLSASALVPLWLAGLTERRLGALRQFLSGMALRVRTLAR